VSVLILREPEIRELISYPETIEAVEKAFAEFSSGGAIMPGVINLDLDSYQGEVHVKSAYLKGSDHYVIKIASGFYRNPALGFPVGNGLMLLFEAETGRLRSVLFDNGYITEMRTGAAGAVAARYLARRDASRVGLVGSGSQARYQVRALLEVRAVREVRVWSPHPDHVARYAAEMAASLPRVRFEPVPACEEAVRGADIVITTTPSRAPLVRAEWVSPGTHITAVGSDGPGKQELDVEVLRLADTIVCDSRTQCARLGEIQHGLAARVLSRRRLPAELGEIVSGRKPGRESDLQITVADLTGLGAQDAVAASLVYKKGLAGGRGEALEI
jgi:ectoine utilization protein EutC